MSIIHTGHLFFGSFLWSEQRNERKVFKRKLGHLIQGRGFIDEHDRDIIPDGKHKPAGFAGKTVALFGKYYIALALRACQNFEKFFADSHNTAFLNECTLEN